MNYYSAKVCVKCEWKKMRGRCIFAYRMLCPQYMAEIAEEALKDKDALKHISEDAIVSALKSKGYSGDLKKSVTVIL